MFGLFVSTGKLNTFIREVSGTEQFPGKLSWEQMLDEEGEGDPGGKVSQKTEGSGQELLRTLRSREAVETDKNL